ncbi:MAG: Holliday junction resolvase RuvX [Patescibacteria group bacterium]
MTYLGIDFGLRRIGLAISEGSLASPWQVIEVKNFKGAVEKISKIIKDGQFQKVIIGMPEGKMGKNVVGFVNSLKKSGLEVETCDETLSSRDALRKMIEQGFPRKKRRLSDAAAAAIILQNYLDKKL